MHVMLQGGSGPITANLVGQYPTLGVVHVQVLTASATIRIGHTKYELESTAGYPAPLCAGLQITTANNIVSLWWAGEMWAMGMVSGPAQVYVEFLGAEGQLAVGPFTPAPSIVNPKR